MKKSIFFLLILIITLSSCKKDDLCADVTITAPASEVTVLRDYLIANSINAVEDSRGFFYIISNSGGGTTPTVCSNVTVNYVGQLTDGSQFDAANDISFPLSNLITGWQEGIPLISSGGSITLYLPPSLGYGPLGSGSIPANSNLIFIIDLKGVN